MSGTDTPNIVSEKLEQAVQILDELDVEVAAPAVSIALSETNET